LILNGTTDSWKHLSLKKMPKFNKVSTTIRTIWIWPNSLRDWTQIKDGHTQDP
jgi:hypothetical protein